MEVEYKGSWDQQTLSFTGRELKHKKSLILLTTAYVQSKSMILF